MEKKKILNVFKINKKNELQILSIIKYFFNKTKMSNYIINHIFGAILIIINYNPKNMTAINEIFDDFCNLDNLLKNELIQQINIFKFNEYNDLYDSIIFDTFCFLKEFKKLEQGNIGFNILHEILYNLLNLDNKIDDSLKCRLYLELLKEIKNNNNINENELSSKHLYVTTIEVCNLIVKLLNDWLN